MTPETRERPRASGALSKKQVGETASPTTVDDTADQMRRRRDASRRLPPLADGLRDPWTAPRRPLSVESARAAWAHLHAHGLMSEAVDRVLRDAAREAAA